MRRRAEAEPSSAARGRSSVPLRCPRRKEKSRSPTPTLEKSKDRKQPAAAPGQAPLGGSPRPLEAALAPEQQAAGCSLPGPAGPREARRSAGRCRPAGRGSEALLVTPKLGLSLKSAAEPLAL